MYAQACMHVCVCCATYSRCRPSTTVVEGSFIPSSPSHARTGPSPDGVRAVFVGPSPGSVGGQPAHGRTLTRGVSLSPYPLIPSSPYPRTRGVSDARELK